MGGRRARGNALSALFSSPPSFLDTSLPNDGKRAVLEYSASGLPVLLDRQSFYMKIPCNRTD
jgi:hypothetical protein